VTKLSTDGAVATNVRALSLDMGSAAAAVALGIRRAATPEMPNLSTVVTNLVSNSCRAGRLIALVLQVANLAANGALFLDLRALRLQVVSAATAVALDSMRTVAF